MVVYPDIEQGDVGVGIRIRIINGRRFAP